MDLVNRVQIRGYFAFRITLKLKKGQLIIYSYSFVNEFQIFQ